MGFSLCVGISFRTGRIIDKGKNIATRKLTNDNKKKKIEKKRTEKEKRSEKKKIKQNEKYPNVLKQIVVNGLKDPG